jgi:mono/diheme cytochrome c family protein
MRTERGNSFAINFVAAAALTTGFFTMTVAGHAQETETAFKARCGQCHGPRDIQYWGRQRADAAARQAWLDQFLRKHYPPSEAERGLIITYIQSTIAAGTAPK